MPRETTEYVNENGSVINVHEVTDETEGAVYLTGVGAQEVRKGDLLVQDNANSYTRIDKSELDKNYKQGNKVSRKQARSQSTVDGKEFDPNEHSASEVNEYLSKVDDTEYTRVVEAERAGKGRVSVLNGR